MASTDKSTSIASTRLTGPPLGTSGVPALAGPSAKLTHGTFHDKNVVVKCALGTQVHRIPILREDELTYNELCVMMARIFKTRLSSNVDNLVLKYKDADGDLVHLESDGDVAHAVSLSSVLRVFVFDKETHPFDAHKGPDAPAGEKYVLETSDSERFKHDLLKLQKELSLLILKLDAGAAKTGSGPDSKTYRPLSNADLDELMEHGRKEKDDAKTGPAFGSSVLPPRTAAPPATSGSPHAPSAYALPSQTQGAPSSHFAPPASGFGAFGGGHAGDGYQRTPSVSAAPPGPASYAPPPPAAASKPPGFASAQQGPSYATGGLATPPGPPPQQRPGPPPPSSLYAPPPPSQQYGGAHPYGGGYQGPPPSGGAPPPSSGGSFYQPPPQMGPQGTGQMPPSQSHYQPPPYPTYTR